jgi:hypothetical protein
MAQKEVLKPLLARRALEIYGLKDNDIQYRDFESVITTEEELNDKN